MDALTDNDPFDIIRNYRKMVARRDRHHKKRKPKQYPPTNIRTRSMEQKQKSVPSSELIEFQHYFQTIPNSSSWHQRDSPSLLLLSSNQRGLENSMEIEAISLEEEEKPVYQKDVFLYWQNEVNNDLNDHELLSIH